MSARILDGKTTAAAIRAEVADRVKALAERETVPGLVAVLVGDDPPSKIYVSGKQKASEEIGIRSRRIDLPATVSERELIRHVDRLGAHSDVHGILVQR